MLSRSCRPIGAKLPRKGLRTSSLSTAHSHHPNAPLDLDPSFKALLKDVDISLLRQKSRSANVLKQEGSSTPRQLELIPKEKFNDTSEVFLLDQSEDEPSLSRKSPAALFGSQRIGAVQLPLELQDTISRLIAESDKPMLHVDAKRLFQHEDTGGWASSYDVKYKSYQQSSRHAERDGTAFASVALPSHYSVIYSVLNNVKHRIGCDWNVDRVIDWGVATGSGLWASLHAFQRPVGQKPLEDSYPQASQSTVTTYLGLDKRDGLKNIGKRLLKNVDTGDLTVTWQKAFQNEDKMHRSQGGNALALSAFLLSSLPYPASRKAIVKEMWESGADIMVLIDHNTRAGFESIAEAREYLLHMGNLELQDPETEQWSVRGSHVVAPCPHDGACPIFHSGSDNVVCGFSQRLQRPAFVRKTKHSGLGHEDTGYSYVVIRRGQRPGRVTTAMGRIGEVGQRELLKAALAQAPITELVIEDDQQPPQSLEQPEDLSGPVTANGPAEPLESMTDTSQEELNEALRQEAYSWPRLIFPPMKRSGHVILDSCTAEGKILRLTVPKSQGKQPYYDARKSAWGDLFPHEPKNPPQERYRPQMQGKTASANGEDANKRKTKLKPGRTSYHKLENDLKDRQVQIKRERAMRRRALEDDDYHL